MLRSRLPILLVLCLLTASAAWADDLGYVDCSNYPGNTQVQAKAAKTHEEAVASLPCGERFTILASGAFFTRIQTKDGKIGYVHSYLVSRDDPDASVGQPSPAPAATKSSAALPLPAARGFSAWAPRATTAASKPTAPTQAQSAPVQPAPAQAPAPTSQVAAPAAPAAQPEPTTPAQPQPTPVQAAPAQALALDANVPAATPTVEQTKPTTPAEPQPTAAQAAATQAPAPAANVPAPTAAVEQSKATTPTEPQTAPAQPAPAQAPAPAANVPAPSPTEIESKPAPPTQPEPTTPAQPQPTPVQPAAEARRDSGAGTVFEQPIPRVGREPMAEFFGGYTFMRLSGTGYGSNIHGALGSFGWNIRPWLQLVADTSYNVATISGTKNVLYGNHYGPRIFFRPRSGRGATPFVEGLFGGSRLDTTSGGYKTSVNGFSVKAGGGLDWKLSPHITIRVLNADYYRTSFGGASQNNYTASTGLILRLLGGGPQ